MTSPNDIIIDILEVLLCQLFLRPQIGQITQLRITKAQKNKNYIILLQK